MRRRTIALLVPLIILFSTNYALAWSGISHFQINKKVGVEPVVVFGINGTGPDMSVQWVGDDPLVLDEDGRKQKWPDYFHSPDPKFEEGTRPFADKPNFAYLMLKTSEKNGSTSDLERAQALGWGGHIAADWVAHNDNLFPICPDGSTGSIKHFAAECLCDLYSFLKGGPIFPSNNVSVAFNDKQIYKALHNYRLISIYENCIKNQEPVYPDKIKQQALETTLPRSYIRERIKSWVAKLAVIQFAYSSGPEMWEPVERLRFLDSMQQRGIESNLALSEMSVNAWVHNPKPRGYIPDYSNQVVPFYKDKLMDIPSDVPFSKLSQVKLSSALSNAQPLVYRAAQVDTSSVWEEDAKLWQSVIDSACQRGDLVVDGTDTADGYQINVSVKDEEGLKDTIENVTKSSAEQGTNGAAGIFWNNLLVNGQSDPTVLTDLFSPELLLVYPSDGSFVNVASPEISIRVQDGADSSGIEPGGVSFYLDDMPVESSLSTDSVSFKPLQALTQGIHRLSVITTDKAGNTSRLTGSFTVDTISPKVCYRFKSYCINDQISRIEILIIPNEPVTYRLTVFPDIGGIPDVNTIVFQRDFEQQKSIFWDGVDNNGVKVANGQYVIRVQAIDWAGNMRTFKRFVKVDRNN